MGQGAAFALPFSFISSSAVIPQGVVGMSSSKRETGASAFTGRGLGWILDARGVLS